MLLKPILKVCPFHNTYFILKINISLYLSWSLLTNKKYIQQNINRKLFKSKFLLLRFLGFGFNQSILCIISERERERQGYLNTLFIWISYLLNLNEAKWIYCLFLEISLSTVHQQILCLSFWSCPFSTPPTLEWCELINLSVLIKAINSSIRSYTWNETINFEPSVVLLETDVNNNFQDKSLVQTDYYLK